MPHYLFILIAALLIAGCSGATHTTSAPSAATPGLSLLIPQTDALPGQCTARALDAEAPPFLTANPMASAAASFREGAGNMAFRGDAPVDRIEEALIGVYDSSHEIGIFAFRFDDPALAQRAGEFIESNDEAQFVLVKDATLAAVWRDGPEDTCFNALATHLAAVLE